MFSRDIDLLVCMGNLDTHRRPSTKYTSNGYDMLPKTPQNIVYRTCHKVRNRINHGIGPYEYLLTTVKRRKLKWYGHESRSSGLSKTTLQGTLNGGRGGQRKRWEDIIKEWTSLSIAESFRASKDQKGWREVIRISVMALLRLPAVMGRYRYRSDASVLSSLNGYTTNFSVVGGSPGRLGCWKDFRCLPRFTTVVGPVRL